MICQINLMNILYFTDFAVVECGDFSCPAIPNDIVHICIIMPWPGSGDGLSCQGLVAGTDYDAMAW